MKWKEATVIGLVGFFGPFLGCTAIAHFILHWTVRSSWLAGVALPCTGERGLQRLSEQVLAIISEHRDALRRPIEESERRITVMKQTIAEAERSMRELSFLFMAEQQHISDMFVDRHKTFLARVLPQVQREFEASMQSIFGWLGPSYRRRAFHEAQEVARRRIMPWLKPEQEKAESEYRRVAARFRKGERQ